MMGIAEEGEVGRDKKEQETNAFKGIRGTDDSKGKVSNKIKRKRKKGKWRMEIATKENAENTL